ncbi:DUF1810 domain-containing protein [Pseudomonas sp. BIGb0164]|uniref:DUF1810 domain-containing protein n=1 Tax=Pseudomonas sp. BIGb0164 TaxID=2940605 RepID=UPI0021691E85|nr:DUF1810 domain-containing protein [Pseudomonas sp. BIGb0164]MCS4250043.1 uncharacterized protein (DUF1810 family) [Pseudomonas sp. BIGb0164]
MTQSLERFVQAQASHYELALDELKRGQKDGHWMWFIFPQLRGLGFSEKATYYGIKDVQEARNYLQHSLLGPRLGLTTQAVIDAKVPLEDLLGEIDALKFASCMTLFAAVAGDGSVYAQARDNLCGADKKTLEILSEKDNGNE